MRRIVGLTAARENWLRTAVRLLDETGYPPTVRSVRLAVGNRDGGVGHMVRALRANGYLVNAPQPPRVPNAYGGPNYMRLTPKARRELGLPLLAYVAWPLPREDEADEAHALATAAGSDLARWVTARLAPASPASPFLTPYRARQTATILAAAAQLARSSDVALILRDPLLLGRLDLRRADLAAIPVILVDDRYRAAVEAGEDPWDRRWQVGSTGIAIRARHA